jgi:hypothetical protein
MNEGEVLLDWILQGPPGVVCKPLMEVRGRFDGRVVMACGPTVQIRQLAEAAEGRGLVFARVPPSYIDNPFARAFPGMLSDGAEDSEAISRLVRGLVLKPELSRIRTVDWSAVALHLANEVPDILADDSAPNITSAALPSLLDLDLSQHRDEDLNHGVDGLLVNVLTGLPVARLRLRKLALTDEGWARVMALPELAFVRDLDLSGSTLPSDPRALFAKMPTLERLRVRGMPAPLPPDALPQGLLWLDRGQDQGGAP